MSQASRELSEASREHKRKMARLRRVCEVKKNGSCHVPHFIHKQWAANSNRDEMLEQLEKASWDIETCLI